MVTKKRQLLMQSVLVLVVVCLSQGLEVTLSHAATLYLPTLAQDGSKSFPFPSETVEQLAYQPNTKLIYGVGKEHIHVISVPNVYNMTLMHSIKMDALDLTDVEVCGHGVFLAYRNNSNKLQGGVRVYNSSFHEGMLDLKLLHDIPLGSLPDKVKATPDCTIVVALENEGFVQGGQFHDPAGGVGVVRFPNGVLGEPEVTLLNFTAFDDQFEQLSGSGVRWVYRTANNSFSDNIEPEYVAFNLDYTTAYIALQENNAVAVVDMATTNITAIYGLGFKHWGLLDASDRDGGIQINSWPVLGMYQPDGLVYVRWNDQDYLITANEGDAQEYDPPADFSEEIRGKDIPDAEIANTVTEELKQALKNVTLLGRLTFSNVDGRNSEGKFENFYAYGARGFSVWRASDLHQVFDSGSDMEQKHAQWRPQLFNSESDNDNPLTATVDTRSDNKGPETETVAAGVLADHLVLFVGNERPGTIAVYSVAPGGMTPQFQSLYTGGIPQDLRTWKQMFDNRDLFAIDPEHIELLMLSNGTADVPVLLVSGSVSGTVSILNVHVTTQSGPSPTDAGSLVSPGLMLLVLCSLLSLLRTNL